MVEVQAAGTEPILFVAGIFCPNLRRNALTPVLRGRKKKINTAQDYVSGFKVMCFKRNSSIHCPCFFSTYNSYDLNAAFMNRKGVISEFCVFSTEKQQE